MNRLAILTTIAVLTMSSPALAAEKESSPPMVASTKMTPIAPLSTGVAPKRPPILPILYSTFGAFQAWDIYSTTAALKTGARERNPIAAPVAGSPDSLITLKAMSTAGTIYFAERIWKTNRVAAVILLAAINGGTATISLHNMRNVR
jgi:hypothetical protein